MNRKLKSERTESEMAALLIPVQGKQMVLPNVSVAEIIPYIAPEQVENVPEWFYGVITWRNLEIPLVSFEGLNSETLLKNQPGERIAVLNGLGIDEGMPFYAIVIADAPRLMRILSDEISANDAVRLGPAELQNVLVSGEDAVIPNLDYIQTEVAKYLGSIS